MKIESFKHRGLELLFSQNKTQGVAPDLLKRIRQRLQAIDAADDISELLAFPGWKLHQLVGARAGTWSLWVSGNWRMTFELDGKAIINMDLEDYH